jgi:hypothetical protein
MGDGPYINMQPRPAKIGSLRYLPSLQMQAISGLVEKHDPDVIFFQVIKIDRYAHVEIAL